MVITPMPYTSRIDRLGQIRMSSHTALVTDATEKLYKEKVESGVSPKIHIAGESTFGTAYASTADLMKKRLIEKGVPETIITTQDNLNNSEPQLKAIKERGIAEPVVVAMQFHQKRVDVLKKQLGIAGETVVAEDIILRHNPKVSKERLQHLAASKTRMFGKSRVFFMESVGLLATRCGWPGKFAVNTLRKVTGKAGASVTDYHYVDAASKHFREAMKDPVKREALLAQRKAA